MLVYSLVVCIHAAIRDSCKILKETKVHMQTNAVANKSGKYVWRKTVEMENCHQMHNRAYLHWPGISSLFIFSAKVIADDKCAECHDNFTVIFLSYKQYNPVRLTWISWKIYRFSSVAERAKFVYHETLFIRMSLLFSVATKRMTWKMFLLN